MNKITSDQPPPYNQIDISSSTLPLHTIQQGPIAHPPAAAIPNQPIVQQQQQQQQQIISTIQIVHAGNQCGCRHNFRSEYTCCGIFCAIFCFPLGLICCFCSRKLRCRHCNMYA